MKITIKRKYFKKGYTIGELYLNDCKMLCNTLEPESRGLRFQFDGNQRSNRLECATQALEAKKKYGKGKVAIPTGVYEVMTAVSTKFSAMRPFITGVPGFSGIMIHEGNTPEDTQGCILVGENTTVGKVMNTRKYVERIIDAIKECERRKEKVMLSIVE